MEIYNYLISVDSFDDYEYEKLVFMFDKCYVDDYLSNLLNGSLNVYVSDKLRKEISLVLSNYRNYDNNSGSISSFSYILYNLNDGNSWVLSEDEERECVISIFNGRLVDDDNIYSLDDYGVMNITSFDTIIWCYMQADDNTKKDIMNKLSMCVKEENNAFEKNKFIYIKKCINNNINLEDVIENKNFKRISCSRLFEQLDIIYNYRLSRNKLILHNRRLVYSIVKRICYSNSMPVRFEDMYSEGYIGLIKAINKFDYRFDYRFSTYAVWWIRQAINSMLENNNNIILYPRRVYEAIKKSNRFSNEYFSKYGVRPDDLEISSFLKLPLEKYIMYRNIYLSCGVDSLEEIVYGDETDSIALFEILEDRKASIDRNILNKDLGEIFDSIFCEFSFKVIDIIKMRYGFEPYDNCHTLEEISLKCELTKERIRQIEKKFLKQVKSMFLKKFDGYIDLDIVDGKTLKKK